MYTIYLDKYTPVPKLIYRMIIYVNGITELFVDSETAKYINSETSNYKLTFCKVERFADFQFFSKNL